MVGLRKLGAEPALAEAQPQPVTTPQGFRAAVLAHELGHATDFEGRRLPALRKAIERGMWLGGQGASILGIARGRPIAAGLGDLVADLPTLTSEGVASLRGYKALKGTGAYTPEQLANIRNTLLSAGSTYAGRTLMDVGQSAGMAALQRAGKLEDLVSAGGPLVIALPFLAKAGVGAGLGALFSRTAKKNPLLEEAKAEDLRQQMGVKGQIYKGAPKLLEDNALYLPPGQHEGWFRKSVEQDLGRLLAGRPSKKTVRQLMEEGGVVMPLSKPPKEKKAEAEQPKKKSLIGRIGKGIGLGAVTLGTGAGILAASDPEATKEVYQTVKGWRLAKGSLKDLGRALKNMKLGSAAPASCEKLSSAHWPTLAKVLVK